MISPSRTVVLFGQQRAKLDRSVDPAVERAGEMGCFPQSALFDRLVHVGLVARVRDCNRIMFHYWTFPPPFVIKLSPASTLLFELF